MGDITIVDIELDEMGPEKIPTARVKLEKDGTQYVFGAQAAYLIDDDKYNKLCTVWEREIAKREKLMNVDKTEVKSKLAKLKGKKIKNE